MAGQNANTESVIIVAEAARAYAARGWKPVPVSRKSKRPLGNGWQKRPFDPAQFNGNAQNVAVQLGAESGGLTDVDLDCADAVGFALEFLPPTGAIFGRKSKPCSHMLYLTDLCKTEKLAAIQYKEYVAGRQGAVIVELRVGADGKGAATIFPPSMHSAGEMVQWVNDGEPARVTGADLKRAVLQLAVACLLKRYYPGQGSRHDAALVIGGVLARAGWSVDDITHVIEAVATAAGDDDVADRVNAAASAVNLKANGENVSGLTRLAEVWGKDAADTLASWFKIRDLRASGKDAGLEDCIALDFAEQHAEDYRYVAATSQWMFWTRTHWQGEDTLAAFDASRKLCRQAGDAKAKTVAAVVTLARSDRRMAATTDQWDTKPEIINTPTMEAA
jgi:hypothetical protein